MKRQSDPVYIKVIERDKIPKKIGCHSGELLVGGPAPKEKKLRGFKCSVGETGIDEEFSWTALEEGESK